MASKVLGALLRVDTLIILALGLTVLALLRGKHRLGLALSTVTLTVLTILAVFPLGELALQPIERTYPVNPRLTRVDGIIVLGGGEDIRATAYWGQTQFNDGAERFTAALALARQFPEARVLFTGGSGALRDLGGTSFTEAEAAKAFFAAQGLDPARLLLEGSSRNTAENASLSLVVARPKAGEMWVLVTSAYHMPRALRSFAAAGWPTLLPYPVDHRTSGFTDGIGWDLARNIEILNIAIREHAGQMAYRLSGR